MIIKKIIYYFPILTILIMLITIMPAMPPDKIYSNPTHRILYIDRNFTNKEMIIIIGAAINWSESTNYTVTYDVVRLPTTKKINLINGLVFSKISSDHPDAMIMNNFDQENTLGYYSDGGPIDYIVLIDNMLNDDNYRAVVLHELGHSLGLKHTIGLPGINTLMYPYTDLSSNYITQTDLENFCKIYKCNANKLKNQESFHFRSPNIFGKFFNFLYITDI